MAKDIRLQAIVVERGAKLPRPERSDEDAKWDEIVVLHQGDRESDACFQRRIDDKLARALYRGQVLVGAQLLLNCQRGKLDERTRLARLLAAYMPVSKVSDAARNPLHPSRVLTLAGSLGNSPEGLVELWSLAESITYDINARTTVRVLLDSTPEAALEHAA